MVSQQIGKKSNKKWEKFFPSPQPSPVLFNFHRGKKVRSPEKFQWCSFCKSPWENSHSCSALWRVIPIPGDEHTLCLCHAALQILYYDRCLSQWFYSPIYFIGIFKYWTPGPNINFHLFINNWDYTQEASPWASLRVLEGAELLSCPSNTRSFTPRSLTQPGFLWKGEKRGAENPERLCDVQLPRRELCWTVM